MKYLPPPQATADQEGGAVRQAFQGLRRNLRTFEGKMDFKDFS